MKTSKYTGVCTSKTFNNPDFLAAIRRDGKLLVHKRFKTEDLAAKAVDLALIRNGYEPINILRRL